MSGLSFLTTAFLWGLLALSIPIILHLMNRELPRPIVFPTIRFIFKGQLQQAGRRGLRDIWTLLTRLAILALIVLLFAGPILLRKVVSFTETAQEIVFFCDLSASMTAVDTAAFVKETTDRIRAANPTARFALIASSNRAEVLHKFDTLPEELTATLHGLQPTPLQGDHYTALKELDTLFTPDETVRKTVYVFTDLQKQDWSPAGLPRLSQNINFEIVNPHESVPGNLAILDVYPEIFVRGQSKRLRATAQVRNYGLEPIKARLSVRAGDVSATREIMVRGEYTEKFIFDLENLSTNLAVADLHLSEGYELDNSFHFWIGPRPPVKVAIIVDEKDSSTKGLETFFLRNALTIYVPGTTKYEVMIGFTDLFWEYAPDQFQCIFLLDSINALAEMEMDVLKEYLNNGGTIVYVPGKKAADNIPKLNHAEMSRVRFLGFMGQIDQLESFSINLIHEGSSVVSIFRDEPGDLLLFPIYKLGKLRAPNASKVLLATDADTPFLIQEDVGKGVLFTFAIGLSPAMGRSSGWSEFPMSQSFLPLIHQLVEYERGQQDRDVLSLVIGDNFEEKLISAGIRETAEIPTTPGVYVVDKIPIELNFTRMESDPHDVHAVETIGHLMPGINAPSATGDADAAVAGMIKDLRGPVAWALLAFILLELIIANARRSRGLRRSAGGEDRPPPPVSV